MSDIIRAKFSEALGSQAVGGYIQSVLLAVAQNNALSECEPVSIIGSALRAAVLRLSVDPGLGHAYLVPFKGKATLVIGYKGLIHMAQRTGKYRYINAGPIFEGETVVEDRITGLHTITGNRTSSNAIGYILAFELVSGFSKTVYMTVEELKSHGRRYSRNFSKEDSLWQTDPDRMFKKTVIRMGLSHWGYLEPSDLQALAMAEDEDSETELQTLDLEAIPPAELDWPLDAETSMDQLGF